MRYLASRYANGNVSWAICGRNPHKLAELARSEGLPADVQQYVADSGNPEQLRAAVGRARVVLTTVGPYARYGSDVVAACAELGVHYCDLSGEVYWMRRMIDRHQATAEASGAIIVHSCGFDSVPSDVGTWFMQREMLRRHGRPAVQVKFRVAEFSGGFSGGTLDSMWAMLEAAARDPSIGLIMADPYALDPAGARRGRDGPDSLLPYYDADFGTWVAPFLMAAINTRIVRRTNALLGYPYGEDFRYDEGMLMRPGALGLLGASAAGLGMRTVNGVAGLAPLRALMQRFGPAPGEGPDEDVINNGSYRIEMHARHPDDSGSNLRGRIRGDRDPGYGSTSKMIAECAMALAEGEARVGGGFWTPAAAMGDALLERLPANAGVTFEPVAGQQL